MLKTIIHTSVVLLCAVATLFVSSPSAHAQATKGEQSVSITQDEALKISKTLYSDDADYYILKETDNTIPYWCVFVDAEPLKGWEHDCYVLAIPKTVSIELKIEDLIIKEKRRVPPTEGDFAPLSVKNRYPNSSNIKPTVKKHLSSNADNTDASRTYAIILSGGINKMANYERYWNDCSFIYQTLVNKYSIPKSNIYPIMSDGDDPAEDMWSLSGDYVSQSLDLDFDGVADISLAATKANVVNTLNRLSRKLNKDDQLLIYVIDHGGTTGALGNSYICLWNGEELYDYELGNLLTPFTDKYVNVNVVLGQCYSGGFINYLSQPGIVIATASDTESWSCFDRPYDEFVYQWTCAVNEADHYGKAVSANVDGNGRVTMEEAFDYANTNDRIKKENPRYKSTPTSVGQDLSLNHVVNSVDLYIKDNVDDMGKEPNTSTDIFWNSASIWVRNKEDGIYKHENPEYSSDHQMAYVYVRIHNRGKEDFAGNGKWLMVYWTDASTYQSAKSWKGREFDSGQNPTGWYLEPKPIGNIAAGDSLDIAIRWALPNKMSENPDGNYDFCLLAKIMDTPYDDGYVDGKSYFDILGSNDQAQKNVTIIKGWTLHALAKLYLRCEPKEAEAYSLEIATKDSDSNELFSVADIKMQLSDKIYSAWKLGGFQAHEVELAETGSNGAECKTVRLLNAESRLENVRLASEEFDEIEIQFDFKKYLRENKQYTIDIIQRNSAGEIIGGYTYIIIPPVVVGGGSVEIEPIPGEIDSYQLSTVDDYMAYTWLNQKGEIIGDTESVTVNPRPNNEKFEVIVATESGDVASGTISFEDCIGIESVNASTIENSIAVKLHKAAPENSTISVVSILDGAINAVMDVPTGAKEVAIDSKMLTRGNYLIIYSENFEIIDEKKLYL